jgi:trimethylamine--corrinoid protein Co-methyltransferase
MSLKPRLEVISADKFEEIHQATIRLLEETGVVFFHDKVLSIFKDHGADVEGNLVRLPQKMVEENIRLAPQKFRWHARNHDRSVVMGESPLVQPAAGPVYVHDLDGGRRPGKLQDYTNLQKIYQALDVFDLVGMISCEPSDISQDRKHLYLMLEILKHTDKPVNGFMTTGDQARAQLDMMQIAMGSQDALDKHHCIAVSIGATSPLTYTWDPLETLLQYVRRNQMVHLLCAPLAGVSAPIGLMDTVVVQNAELLAGIVLTQLVEPGAPVVYGPSATAADMQSGDFFCGTPEGMLINMANIQLATQYYNVPARAMTGITDAKIADYQAGFETMQNLMMGMLAGAHLLNEAVGILDNILTVSYEKTIIDGELISRVKRIMQGIDGPDCHIDIETITEVGHGGNYLMHDATLQRCRDRWRASQSYCGSFNDWEADGARDIVRRSNKTYKEILAAAPQTLVETALEEELRAYIDAEID